MSISSAKSQGMRRQLRQAPSQDRVGQILDVAEQMFIRDGHVATTTNAIAARAQVSIGSLYQFFPDKAAIVSLHRATSPSLGRARFNRSPRSTFIHLCRPAH